MNYFLLILFFASSLFCTAQNIQYNIDGSVSYDGLQADPGANTTIKTDREMSVIMDSIYFYYYDTQSDNWILKQKTDDYNYDGQLQRSYIKYIREGNAWVFNKSTSIKYSASNDPDTTIEKSWQGNTWQNYSMMVEDYDDNHNQTRQLMRHWINGSWKDESETLYTYDASGNLLTQIFRLSIANNNLLNDSRTIVTYYDNGKKNTETFDKWQDGVWVPTSRFTYSYNVAGLRDTMFFEQYLYDFWQYDWLIAYTFDNENKVETSLQRDFSYNQWTDQLMYHYSYDEMDRQTLLAGQKWVNGEWVDESRLETGYDQYGNANFYLHSSWNGMLWSPQIKMHQTFDENGFMVSASSLYYNQNLVSFGDSSHFYFRKSLGLKEHEPESINLYPNPGNGLFIVDSEYKISRIEIYNINGLLVHIFNEPGRIIDISDLPKGPYTIILHSNKRVLFSKVLKL